MTRSYTYIGDVIRGVSQYFEQGTRDPVLYNLASDKAVSEYEFAKIYAETFGHDPSLVEEAVYQRPGDSRFAFKPFDCSLDSSKISKDYGLFVQSPSEGLHELKERLRTGWTRKWTL